MIKFIYWIDPRTNNGKRNACVHLISERYGESLRHFKEMVRELRKTFPLARDGEIECGRIVNSSSMYGFPIIRYQAKIEYREYDGWVKQKTADYRY